MEKTTKEKTIEKLLEDREKLTAKTRSWFCSWNQGLLIADEIRAIDKLILELNK